MYNHFGFHCFSPYLVLDFIHLFWNNKVNLNNYVH